MTGDELGDTGELPRVLLRVRGQHTKIGCEPIKADGVQRNPVQFQLMLSKKIRERHEKRMQ